MAITIPALPNTQMTKITLISSAVELSSPCGGPTRRISRLGDRFSVEVNSQKIAPAQAGQITSALLRGLSETVLFDMREKGVDYSIWTDGTVSAPALAGSKTISIAGGGSPKAVGRLFSINKGGRRYLHQIVEVPNAKTVKVIPAIRIDLSIGDALEFGNPKSKPRCTAAVRYGGNVRRGIGRPKNALRRA